MREEKTGPHELLILPAAQKDIRALREQPLIKKAFQAIGTLEVDPYNAQTHALSNNLRGARAIGFKGPGGDYRAVYVIDEDKLVVIFLVGPHENIYEKAWRRLEAVQRAFRIRA